MLRNQRKLKIKGRNSDKVCGGCYNLKASNYEYYGARGVTICDQWVDSFKQFVSDMGPRPEGYSIDRIDNNLGYSPAKQKPPKLTI